MKFHSKKVSFILIFAMIISVFNAASIGVSAAVTSNPVSLQSGSFTYTVVNNSAEITGFSGADTNLVIPESIGGYTVKSIGDFAFYQCDSLTSVQFCNTLESIGAFAFSECTNLSEINIPANVSNIGEFAFWCCGSVGSVSVAEQNTTYDSHNNCNAIIETGSHSLLFGCRSTVIPNDVKIIKDSAFYMCDGLTDIQIPDSVTTIEDEAFYFCTDLERVIIGENVKSIGDRSFFMCQNLFSVVFGNSLETIGEDAFFDCEKLQSVTIPNGMKKISDYAFQHCLEMVSVTIPKNVTSIGKFAFGECRSLENVYYAGSKSDWNKIEIDDGNFYLTIADFCYETPDIDIAITPVVTSKGAYGGEGIGKATVKAQNSKSLSIKFEKNLSFKVPSSVPMIGGGDVSLDMSSLPISAKTEGDKLTVAIGFNKDLTSALDNVTWSSFKNFVKGNKENSKKGEALVKGEEKPKAKAGMGKSLNFEFYGYYEAILKDGKITSGSGLSRLKLDGTFSGEWQTAVGFVPVVLKLDGYVGADSTILLSVDEKDLTVKMDADLKLTLPDITASAGLGISHIADVSVYGKAKNEVTFSSNPKGVKGTLYGEIGASVNSFLYSTQKTFFKLKNGEGWTYYDSTKKYSSDPVGSAPFDEDSFKINRRYLKTQSSWLANHNTGKNVSSVGSGTDENFPYSTLQTSIYDGANPKLISTDNDMILVWTGDDSTRTDGNQTVVYYSLYNGSTNEWSAPAAVEDNGTADFYPDIATDGTNTYITWTDSKTVFDENVTMDQTAAACEIKIAKFDASAKEFVSVHRLTNNNTLDTKSSVSVVNGKATVVWKNNSANAVLNNEGTETIYKAVETNGAFTTNAIYSTDKKIYELVNGGNFTAFSADTDGNLNSADDSEIFIIKGDNSVVQLTNNTYNEYNLAISHVNQTNSLTFLSEGVIYSCSDMQTFTPISNAQEQITGSYQFAGNRLFSVSNNESGAEIFAYTQNENGLWANPVKASSVGSYVRDPSFVINNGATQCVFLKSSADISETDVIETTDLCAAVIPDYHHVAIGEVLFEGLAENQDNSINVSMQLNNLGTIDETSVGITVKDGDDIVYKNDNVNADIKSGEKKEITITVPLETKLKDTKNLVVYLNAAGIIDTKEFTVGYAQLILSTGVGIQNGSFGLIANVTNDSDVSTGAAIKVMTEKNGELLDTFSLNEISGKSSLSFLIDNEKLAEYKAKTNSLFIELISYKPEEALVDNSETVSLDAMSVYDIGDTNRDGVVNISDVTVIQKQVAKIIASNTELYSISDIDNNGSLNVRDATLLQRKLARFVP